MITIIVKVLTCDLGTEPLWVTFLLYFSLAILIRCLAGMISVEKQANLEQRNIRFSTDPGLDAKVTKIAMAPNIQVLYIPYVRYVQSRCLGTVQYVPYRNVLYTVLQCMYRIMYVCSDVSMMYPEDITQDTTHCLVCTVYLEPICTYSTSENLP